MKQASQHISSGLIFLGILVCFAGLRVQAQPRRVIDPQAFNAKLLEHHTKLMIDSVREAHNLERLYNDSILYRAAKDHARYLRGRSKIGHVQDVDRKATPDLRIKYYGGRYPGTGENVARIYIHRKTRLASGRTGRIRTYREAARQLAEGWVNSPPHYQNIITEGYRITGMAVSYNRKNDAVNAVQTFGMVRNGYIPDKTSRKYFPYQKPHRDNIDRDGSESANTSHTNNIGGRSGRESTRGDVSEIRLNSSNNFFDRLKKNIRLRRHIMRNGGQVTDPHYYYPHKRHDFAITYEPDCEACQEYQRLTPAGNQELRHNRDSAYMLWGGYHRAERIFDERRDGLVLEIVPFSYYRCDTCLYEALPRRSNGGCAFNGKIRKPRYRRNMFNTLFFKKDDHGRPPDEFFPYLGSLDEFKDQLYEINVLALQDNKICRVHRFFHVNGRLWHYRESIDPLPLHFNWDSLQYIPNLTPHYQRERVYFEPNETHIPRDSLQSLYRIQNDSTLKVDLVRIDAYASIEGHETNNKELFRQRADNVVQLLGLNNQDSIRIKRHQSENWKKLSRQLDKNHFSFLKGLDEKRIRRFVNQPANKAAMERLLDAQRFVRVIMRYFTRITPDNIHQLAIGEYTEVYRTLKTQYQRPRQNLHPKLMDRLTQIYKWLLQEHRNGKVEFAKIATLPVVLSHKAVKHKDRNDPLDHLKKFKYRFQLQFGSDTMSQPERVKRLKYLTGLDNTHPNVKFNYQTYQINQINTLASVFYDQKDLRKLQHFISYIKGKVPPKDYRSMKLYYHFARANKAYRKNPYTTTAKRSLRYIFNHYPVKNLSRRDRIKFARYFVSFRKWEYALKVLEPLTKEPLYEPRAYRLWLIIRYGNYNKNADFDYYREIIRARKKLSDQQWCRLFTGNERVNFQILDYQPLRMLYCKTCGSGKK